MISLQYFVTILEVCINFRENPTSRYRSDSQRVERLDVLTSTLLTVATTTRESRDVDNNLRTWQHASDAAVFLQLDRHVDPKSATGEGTEKRPKKLSCSRPSWGSLPETATVFDPECLKQTTGELEAQLQPHAQKGEIAESCKVVECGQGRSEGRGKPRGFPRRISPSSATRFKCNKLLPHPRKDAK